MSYDYSPHLTLSTTYTAGEARGVGLLVAAGTLSLLSVIALLVIMALSAYRSKGGRGDDHVFVRTHVAAYFLSLLLCDLTQGLGSIINIAWINNMGVTYGPLCIAQGAIKQTGNVGTALWSFVIAVHTFFLLFYRAKISNWVCYSVLVFVWCLHGFIMSIGAGILQSKERGPFYGISGLWCWMTPEYPVERYALEYAIEFVSAGLSFILYGLVFFRLRGNINVEGWKFTFQRRVVVKGYSNRQYNAVTDPSQNTHVMKVARQMMWYPVAYTILVVPIAAARFASFSGKPVPYEVTIATATIFMLSGFVNAVLFTTTRRVVPASSIFPKFIREKFGISTGSGMNTQQRSLHNTGLTSRASKYPHLSGMGVSVSVNVEKEIEYDLEGSASPGSYQMSQRPIRPFDNVSPFNNQSLGSPTTQGRKVVWGDATTTASDSPSRKRGSSIGSTNSDGSAGKIAGDSDVAIPIAMQYPSPPRHYQQSQLTPRYQPSVTPPNVHAYLNPRDRGDRGMSAAYAYAGQDITNARN